MRGCLTAGRARPATLHTPPPRPNPRPRQSIGASADIEMLFGAPCALLAGSSSHDAAIIFTTSITTALIMRFVQARASGAAAEEQMAISRRRVVTGVNEEGQSFIVSDGPTPSMFNEHLEAWGGTWSSAEMFRDDPAAKTSLMAVDPVQSAITIEPQSAALPSACTHLASALAPRAGWAGTRPIPSTTGSCSPASSSCTWRSRRRRRGSSPGT